MAMDINDARAFLTAELQKAELRNDEETANGNAWMRPSWIRSALHAVKHWEGWQMVPDVKDLEARMLALIESGEQRLDMSDFHGDESGECGTVHCLAGFARVIAGEAADELAETYYDNSGAIGVLIYAKSCGYLPDFLASNEDALRDLRARVASK